MLGVIICRVCSFITKEGSGWIFGSEKVSVVDTNAFPLADAVREPFVFSVGRTWLLSSPLALPSPPWPSFLARENIFWVRAMELAWSPGREKSLDSPTLHWNQVMWAGPQPSLSWPPPEPHPGRTVGHIAASLCGCLCSGPPSLCTSSCPSPLSPSP